MNRTWLLAPIFVVPLLVSASCADLGASDGGYGGAQGSGDGIGVGGPGSEEPDLPPELELEENFRSPVVTGPYLWSANPESGLVAVIDARSLKVVVREGGHGPTYLGALPQQKDRLAGALVINTLSHDVSVFRVTPAANPEDAPEIDEQRPAIHEGASAWAVGETGRFAIAWSRSADGLLGASDGYQDISILQLDEPDVIVSGLSVGFRPSQVHINTAETKAFVVSDPGISVIDLTAVPPAVERELFLPETTVDAPRDVSFTADGTLALVRLEGQSDVLVIETATNNQVTVALPRPVTDLDLSADGSMAVAVMRGTAPTFVPGGGGGAGGQGGAPGGQVPGAESLIALLPVPQIFQTPGDFQVVAAPSLVGSATVAADATSAVLYTNAAPIPFVTVMDLEEQSFRVVNVKVPVQAALVSDESDFSVALLGNQGDSARAFALVSLDRQIAARISNSAQPIKFASLAAGRALITSGTSGSPGQSFLASYPSLTVDPISLPSGPLSGGMVPEANQAFVSQEHPEGRVTFIDLDSSLPRTVTGFELASKVVQ